MTDLRDMKLRMLLITGVAGLVVLALPTPGLTQVSDGAEEFDNQLEEVIVTAQKRTADLQDTAISLALITGEDAIRKGNINMDDMLRDMVNVNAQQIGFGTAINIRGMGWDLPVDVGESAVSVNFDGAANNNLQATIFGYFDMERMEVLRGPQGTLYGRNATAGAVNVVFASPNPEGIEGYALAEAGNYSHRRFEGAFNLPLTESQAVRIAASDVKRDGYMSTGAADADGTAIRAKYLFQPGDDFRLELTASHFELGGISPDPNVAAADYEASYPYLSTLTSPDQRYDFSSTKFSGIVDWKVGPGVVTFIPSYEESDSAGTALVPFGPGAGTVQPAVPSSTTQKSGELRYASLPDSNIQWQAGLYYYDRVQDVYASPVGNPNCGEGCRNGATNKAAFGHLTIPLRDTLRLVLGARVGTDEAILVQSTSFDPAFTNARSDWNVFNWKVGLEADVSDAAMAYATIATSSRPGGFNLINGSGNPEFDQEKVTSYETGLKSRWWDQRLQVNGALFYYDYQDYQTVDIFFDPSRNPPFVGNFFNAGSARNFGAELETITLLGDSTRLNLAASYLNAKFDSDIELHPDPFGPPVNINGSPLPRSPKWTLKGSFEHTIELGDAGSLTGSVSYRWLDNHQLTVYPVYVYPVTLVDSYSVVDLYANYDSRDGKWGANLWVKNLGEKVYKLSGSQNNIIAGPPRMYGVSVTYRF